jgi:hypothetical protein
MSGTLLNHLFGAKFAKSWISVLQKALRFDPFSQKTTALKVRLERANFNGYET